MNISIKRIFLAIVLAMGIVGQNWATNLYNLKGTYSILPENLQEFSVLDGAIAWHTGAIRRLYDLGHVAPGEPIDEPSRTAFKAKLEQSGELKKIQEKINSVADTEKKKKL